MERREFIKASAMMAGAMAVPNILRAQGSKTKVRMGFIGVGNRGTQLLHIFMKNPLVEVTALADIYEPLSATILHSIRSSSNGGSRGVFRISATRTAP